VSDTCSVFTQVIKTRIYMYIGIHIFLHAYSHYSYAYIRGLKKYGVYHIHTCFHKLSVLFYYYSLYMGDLMSCLMYRQVTSLRDVLILLPMWNEIRLDSVSLSLKV